MDHGMHVITPAKKRTLNNLILCTKKGTPKQNNESLEKKRGNVFGRSKKKRDEERKRSSSGMTRFLRAPFIMAILAIEIIANLIPTILLHAFIRHSRMKKAVNDVVVFDEWGTG
jgi:hypothetical protein